MSERVLGLTTSKDGVLYVDVEIPDNEDEPLTILEDGNWKLQKGDRSNAYQVLHQQCSDYVQEANVDKVLVKASAVMGGMSAKLGLLQAAEVRGVIIAASASTCPVKQVSKAVVSRVYGDRKVDDYINDDAFWEKNTSGISLRKMSREAVMLVIASRNE